MYAKKIKLSYASASLIKEYELDEYLENWTCSKIVLNKLAITCSDTVNISKTVSISFIRIIILEAILLLLIILLS